MTALNVVPLLANGNVDEVVGIQHRLGQHALFPCAQKRLVDSPYEIQVITL
jgi:hypothetical protein